MMSEDGSMAGFVQEGLEKLLAASSRKHKALRTTIAHSLNHIREMSPAQRAADCSADKYFLAMKLACESESAKLMAIALDHIQKLIAHGYLRGASVVDPKVYPPPESDRRRGDRRRLIDVIVETVYACSMYENDRVQLQVIKALLTAVTSSTCRVHGHSLLQAVRACYHIFLTSRHMANTTTARATLTQILSILFQRMEHYACQLQELAGPGPSPSSASRAISAAVTAAADGGGGGGGGGDDGGDGSGEALAAAREIAGAIVSAAVSQAEGEEEEKVDDAAPERKDDAGDDEISTTPAGVAENVADAAGGPRAMAPTPPLGGPRSKLAQYDDIVNHPDPKNSPHSPRTVAAATLALLENDCFLLFRALCRLSMKMLPNPPEAIALASKQLSLELLLSVMTGPGPTFRDTPLFVDLVRESLVMSLLQNSVTTIEPVFRLSSSIFVTLIAHFKPHLKTEIGVFLDNIFLKILATPNSTFAHKKMALKVLSKLVGDPQTLVELFLNYDCELGSANIYLIVTNQLEKIAQGRFVSKNWMSSEQENLLRRLALEGFIHIMKSLVEWCRRALPRRARAAGDGDGADGGGGSTLELPAAGGGGGDGGGGGGGGADGNGSDADGDHDGGGGALASSPSGTSAAEQVPRPAFSEQYNLQREQQRRLERGVYKFNVKPKDGIAYLREHGFVDDTPESLADFLHEHHKMLNKTEVGDYLGDHREFQKKVLYCYVERMNFRGLTFDDGIRTFLAGFRLPVEAQKIDRMMEKFAEQYCADNPGLFESADTAYVLAYAVIMLNTDAHNDQVKNKMEKEQFLRLTQDTDTGKLDPAWVGALYDRIVNNEIMMAETAQAASERDKVNPESRYFSFARESEQMVERTTQLIRRGGSMPGSMREAKAGPAVPSGGDQDVVGGGGAGGARAAGAAPAAAGAGAGAASSKDGPSAPAPAPLPSAVDAYRRRRAESTVPWYQASLADFDAVRPMFETVWYPVLGTFSIILEDTEDLRLISLCLDGYRHAIRISSVFGMDTPRVAFCKSLRQVTLLGTQKEMQQKNIDAIRMLLEIAYYEGNHLRDSWGEVLECISEFERLHLIASGSRPRMDVFTAAEAGGGAGGGGGGGGHAEAARRHAEAARDSQNSETVTRQIDSSLIDRIFTNSANLGPDAIVDFVDHLRRVSEKELGFDHTSIRVKAGAQDTPRVFSLQKIVEITYYNMGRIRLVWARIWHVLSDYFVKAGCHPNLNVSMFVIDSLRQLAMKFLEKDELSNYQFQKHFLKPFEHIMVRSTSVEIKELVVQVLSRMILARADNIKSGWRSVFVVFSAAARSHHEPLIAAAFAIVEQIMREKFHVITETIDECVNCLVAFGESGIDDFSLQAIEYLGLCADYLGEGGEVSGHQQLQEAKHHAQHHAADGGGDAAAVAAAAVAAGTAAEGGGGGEDLPAPAGRVQRSASVTSEASAVSMSHPEDSDIGAWFLVLTGLSRMIGDERLPVRSRALQVLFKILRTYGNKFSQSTWQMIFRGVLFPIFDDATHAPLSPAAGGPDQGEWLKTTCFSALTTLVELFAFFRERVEFLMPEVLDLLRNCIDQENEDLSSNGVRCLVRLLHVTGHELAEDQWDSAFAAFAALFTDTLPHELLSNKVKAMYLREPPASAVAPLAHSLTVVFGEELDELVGHGVRVVQPEGFERAEEAAVEREEEDVEGDEEAEQVGSEEEEEEAAEEEHAQEEQKEEEEKEKEKEEEDAAGVEDEAGGDSEGGAAQEEPDAAAAHENGVLADDGSEAAQDGDEMDGEASRLEADATAAAPVVAKKKLGPRPPPGPPPGPPPPVPIDKLPPPPSPRRAEEAMKRKRSFGEIHKQAGQEFVERARVGQPLVLPFHADAIVSKCKTQLLLMDAAFEVVMSFFDILRLPQIDRLLLSLLESVQFAHAFNREKLLRQRLWQAGFLQQQQSSPPQLHFQEAHGLRLYLQVLFRVFARDSYEAPFAYPSPAEEQPRHSSRKAAEAAAPLPPRDRAVPTGSRMGTREVTPEWRDAAMASLVKTVRMVMNDYVGRVRREESAEDQRALRCMSAVVAQIAHGFADLRVEEFTRLLPEFYFQFVDLIRVGSPDVRDAVATLFSERVAGLLPLDLTGAKRGGWAEEEDQFSGSESESDGEAEDVTQQH